MKKILVITSTFIEQDSVSSISKNIISAFKMIPDSKLTIVESEIISTKRLSVKPDFIVLAHPSVITSLNLSGFLANNLDNQTSLIFYIFGDYIRKAPFYLKLEENLRGKKVFFITASNSYNELVKKTLVNKESCLKLPFPLNVTRFSFKKNNADDFRKKYKFKRNDFVVLYTGRISQQKNLHLLIKTVQKINKMDDFKNKVKLIFFGNTDEFEASTFFEKNIIPGQYFQLLNKQINKDPNVQFCARTEQQELAAAYGGSDLFISLSLYHDEDFGFSPIEALCSGTKVLLTNWGGYKDLKLLNEEDKKFSHYIDVHFQENYLEINEVQLYKTLKQMITRVKIDSKSIKKIKTKFSISSLSKSYNTLLNQEIKHFEGFHEDFSTFTLSFMTSSIPSIDQYEYFYRSFWQANEI